MKKINLNWVLYVFVIILMLVGVYGVDTVYNDPSIYGHTAGEISGLSTSYPYCNFPGRSHTITAYQGWTGSLSGGCCEEGGSCYNNQCEEYAVDVFTFNCSEEITTILGVPYGYVIDIDRNYGTSGICGVVVLLLVLVVMEVLKGLLLMNLVVFLLLV